MMYWHIRLELNTELNIQSRLIGLQLDGSSLLPFLKKVITIASLQSFGIHPIESMYIKSEAKSGADYSILFYRSSGGMLSFPGAFPLLS